MVAGLSITSWPSHSLRDISSNMMWTIACLAIGFIAGYMVAGIWTQ